MELLNFKCKTCGAPLDELAAKSTDGLVTCQFCGNVWTVPKHDITPDALQFLHIGEHDLDTGKFDDAFSAYKKAAELDSKEPEAYFGMALAEFRIQYLKDHVNNRVQPICYEVTDKKFTDSGSYLRALLNATPEQKVEYEKKGAEIDYILGEFFKLKQAGIDYDCFICVKVTDDKTKQLTEDSKDADYIYRLLQDKGYKPFFSERELRNVTGADYEARILYALATSECMLVVCRNEEYLQTPWVKNEYMRFLKLINDEEKESDSITIVFNGKPIEKLPNKNGKIQGINFALRESDSKIINFVDSHTPEAKARRIEEERRKAEEQQETAKRFKELEEQVKNAATSQRSMEVIISPLLMRGYQALNVGEFQKADNYFDLVLEFDPENGEAYFGKLLAELKINKRENLPENTYPIHASLNYQKAYKFGNEKLRGELKTASKRIEETRNDYKYNEGCKLLASSKIEDIEKAIEIFKQISDWKDSGQKITECQEKIKELKTKAEQKQSEMAREAAVRKRKIIIGVICIICVLIAAIIALIVCIPLVIKRNQTNTNQTNTDWTYNYVMPLKEYELGKGLSNIIVYNDTLKQWLTHNGVDFKAEKGSEIMAIFDGKVLSIGETPSRGIVVSVEHTGGIIAYYMSLSSDVRVNVNDVIKTGQLIGYVDSTMIIECDEGPHLHLEMIKDGVYVNPLEYLPDGSDK